MEVVGITKAVEMTEKARQVDESDDESSFEDDIDKKDKWNVNLYKTLI